MKKIDLINSFIKIFLINIFIFIIFIKIINYKKLKISKIIVLIIFSLITSIIYINLIKFINIIIFLLLLFPIYNIILSYILNKKINAVIIPLLIAIIITYIFYIISTVIYGFIIYKTNIEYSNPINIFFIMLIEFFIIYRMFKFKRFKNGFYFLNNENMLRKINIIAICIYILIMLTYNILFVYNTILFVLSLIISIWLVIWIKSEITKHYKENMKNRTIELQKIEIDEQIKNINELKENNLKLSTVIHKYNNRLSALEKAVVKTLNNNLNTEFASELTRSLENIKEISNEFSKEVMDATNKKKKLPKTNIQSIDNIFEYMQEEAIKENINFDLKINSSINYLIENIIDVKDFETLIGDHIRDAIIAINSEKVENKNIMCILGIVENCYEFSIYDTGIEFEIDTLLNLGLKHITTHSETGGTGIGFMTSFKTLNKCKGSLIIEEYCKETNIYTKCVTFRFDSKGEYRIYSYRSDQIKSEMKDKNRIKVKQI